MRKIILIILFTIFSFNVLASGVNDLFSRSFWVDLSGSSSGSTTDIVYKYLGSLGYTGDLNDRIHKWLVDQTGLSSSLSTSDLALDCFVTNQGCYAASNGRLTFLGSNLLFNGSYLTFNP